MASSVYTMDFPTLCPAKLRVQAKDFYGERNLVNDPLSGAVTAGEQLQVLDPIVIPDTVLVMHGFLGTQLPANVLLHDVAVFEHFPLLASAAQIGGNVHPNVPAPLAVTPTFAVQEPLSGDLLTMFGTAFSAAQSATPEKPGGGALVFNRFAAVNAVHNQLGFGVSTTANRTARNGAVQRWASKLLDVTPKFSRSTLKGLAARFAGELLTLHSPRSLGGFVSVVAGAATKLSCGGLFRLCHEVFAAVKAGLLNRHCHTLFATWYDNNYQNHASAPRGIMQGVA